jgi:hypothetical protein
LSIEEREMRAPNLEAIYTEVPFPAAAAISVGADAHTRRVLELAVHGLFRHRRPPGGRKWFYAFESWERVDFEAALAISAVVAEMEPGWVEAVAEARNLSEDPRLLSAWTRLHPYAVLGALSAVASD